MTLVSDEESDARLAELVLYVAKKSQDDPKFGAVKLNKILFFADFIYYRETGEPITGAKYQRLPQGPAPKRVLPVINQLVESGRATMQLREVFTFQQKRLVPLSEPNLNIFTGAQIAFIDSVLAAFQNATAKQTSDLSHTLPAWLCAENYEEIPYDAAFVLPPQYTPEDAARALLLEQRRASSAIKQAA